MIKPILIVAGPHRGEVHDFHLGMRYIEIPIYSEIIRFTVTELDGLEHLAPINTASYTIEMIRAPNKRDPYYVGVPVFNTRDVVDLTIRTAMDKAFERDNART